MSVKLFARSLPAGRLCSSPKLRLYNSCAAHCLPFLYPYLPAMDEDIRLFSELLTPDILAKAEHDFHRDMSSTNPNVRVIPPDPLSGTSKLNLDGVKDHTMFIKAITEVKPRFPPLERLPCANVEVEKNRICQLEGTMACSACKLVSYCSKVSFSVLV